MVELITTTEAVERLTRIGIKRTSRYLAKLCAQGRIEGAEKRGRDWMIPEGAKIEPTGLGRPLRTLEIPREGKKGLVRAPANSRQDPKGKR